MSTDVELPDAPKPPRRVIKGLRGWWMRMQWRREARQMNEAQIDELRKRLVIIDRQLDQLPISSKLFRRRMELLRDRERCETIIAAWEEFHGS